MVGITRYLCVECFESFDGDEAETKYEPHPYGDYTAYERYHVCPYCGSQDIMEYLDTEEFDREEMAL